MTRQLTSATAALVEYLIREMKLILEGKAEATVEEQCDEEAKRLYRNALSEVTQRLPELRPRVMEAWSARNALYETASDGNRDRLNESGERLIAAISYLLCQSVLIEGEQLVKQTPPPCPSGLDSESHPDGPELPDKFWWKGKSHDLRPMACRLLVVLCIVDPENWTTS